MLEREQCLFRYQPPFSGEAPYRILVFSYVPRPDGRDTIAWKWFTHPAPPASWKCARSIGVHGSQKRLEIEPDPLPSAIQIARRLIDPDRAASPRESVGGNKLGYDRPGEPGSSALHSRLHNPSIQSRPKTTWH